jgi:hypothetical protein
MRYPPMQLFPKSPDYRRLTLRQSRNQLMIVECKLDCDQRVGDMNFLTASVGGHLLLQARGRLSKTSVFAIDSRTPRLSFPPFRKRFSCAGAGEMALNSNNYKGRVIPHSEGLTLFVK